MTTNYVSTEEAAKVLGCTTTHIALLCRTGKLEAVRPLGRWRINQDALNKLMGVTTVEEGEQEDGTDNERIDI